MALIGALRFDSGSRSRETPGRSGENRSLTTSATLLAVTAFRNVTIKANVTNLGGARFTGLCRASGIRPDVHLGYVDPQSQFMLAAPARQVGRRRPDTT